MSGIDLTSTLCIVYTIYTICIVHIVHCIGYAVHYIVYNMHYEMYTYTPVQNVLNIGCIVKCIGQNGGLNYQSANAMTKMTIYLRRSYAMS